ncbi:MAG: hypothetical protein M3R30_02545 [Candidatus Eremiobacteraeota bacterium]|nr:hypothetical protein [Candidatus Eremiobacteraeota bacterium]
MKTAAWPLAWRILFRFVFCYVALFAVHTVDGIVDLLAYDIGIGFGITALPESMLHALIPWIGANVLHLGTPITIFTNGSGDTTFDWVLVATNLAIAAVAAIVWSMLDRHRLEYERLWTWLQYGARMLLAAELLSYGLDKVIPLQFGILTPSRAIMPFGFENRMGVLWDFMAASPVYTVFAGAAETLGGILLLFPRLATLGALVAFGCMVNVFVLNIAYDVPVKIFSLHLALLAVLVLVPALPRLADLLVRARPADALVVKPLIDGGRRDALLMYATLVAFAFFTTFTIVGGLRGLAGRSSYADPTAPLYGMWRVESFEPRHAAPDSVPDDKRWQWLAIDSTAYGAIVYADGVQQPVSLAYDPATRVLALYRSREGASEARFTVTPTRGGDSILDGDLGGDPIRIRIVRVPISLMEQGIHLVKEHAY